MHLVAPPNAWTALRSEEQPSHFTLEYGKLTIGSPVLLSRCWLAMRIHAGTTWNFDDKGGTSLPQRPHGSTKFPNAAVPR